MEMLFILMRVSWAVDRGILRVSVKAVREGIWVVLRGATMITIKGFIFQP
jgi:hypothetical protein